MIKTHKTTLWVGCRYSRGDHLHPANAQALFERMMSHYRDDEKG